MENKSILNTVERSRLRRLIEQDSELVIDLILELKAQNLDLRTQVMQLAEKVAELEGRLNKNSRNSSKPPGSDGYKKPNPKSLRKKGKRKNGGQFGHRGKTLEMQKDPDKIVKYKLTFCPITGRRLRDRDIVGVVRRQVFELPEPKLNVIEHRVYKYRVPGSNQTVQKSFPDGVQAPTQYGFKFCCWLVYLSDYQLLPLNRISQMCADLYGYGANEQTVYQSRKRCYGNLEKFEQYLKQNLPVASVLHGDETGIRIAGKRQWLHCVSDEKHTYLEVHDNRGMKAIEAMEVLPKFRGILVHDCWATYFRLDCEHSLCNAHLIRELIFQKEECQQEWAKNMEKLLWQAYENPYKKSLKDWQDQYSQIVEQGYKQNPYKPPPRKKGQRGRCKKPQVLNLLERFEKHRDSVLRFIENAEVPFTNNQAERDIRMVKVQQKISGCFRSWQGARIFARNRSYISTAIKQGHRVFDALFNAVSGNPCFC